MAMMARNMEIPKTVFSTLDFIANIYPINFIRKLEFIEEHEIPHISRPYFVLIQEDSFSDNESVKKSLFNALKIFSLCTVLSFLGINKVDAYVCKYKEDYYKLYHIHHQQLPDDTMENIWWLEQAVKADFCNPLYAYTKIENETEWEKYRCLFQMHLNLKLIEQHLRLGRIYDKKVAYFYDAPWKDEYLRNLEKAKSCYEICYIYWQEASIWAEKANVGKFKFLYLTGLQNWEDERERIGNGKLDYKKTLDRELSRLNKVVDDLKSMDKTEGWKVIQLEDNQ